MGRDSDASSPIKPRSLQRGSRTVGGPSTQAPASETRGSFIDKEPESTQQLSQDVYPLAPQQWFIKKKNKDEKEKASVIWNKGYPEIGIPDDTNEGDEGVHRIITAQFIQTREK